MSLDILLSKLDLAENKGLYRTAEKKWEKLGLPFRTQKILELIKPTAFYCINDEPYILFFENPDKKDEIKLHREIWNFSQAPLAFIIADTTISVFNAFCLDRDGQHSLQLLDKLNINDSNAKMETYSIWNLISGKYWADNKNTFKSDDRVDWYLLKNIEEAIFLLEEKKLSREIANKIIGFLIFTRYLIDRKVKIDEKYINNETVEHARKSLLTIIQTPGKLIEFYNHLKAAFNGDLFELTTEELKKIDSKHCGTLNILFQGGEVLKKQPSLFNIYDFEIIPIELVSNVYERFIGKDKQSENKAFYTPPFLVDYILEKTVKEYLKEANSSCCRVLDPACGSGIFLVEIFRQIIEKEKKLKGDKLTANELESLLIDNIYGIDKDEIAIDIAIFSLYITLLDYKEPREIVNYKFPYLKYKENMSESERGHNFFKVDFLEWGNPVFNFIKNRQFDFIIGNPPWGSIKTTENKAFIGKCKNENIIISDYQIAQSFLIRAEDFSQEGKTQIALIVTSKILYNVNANQFRNYFLKNFEVDEIFNFSPVGRLVFDGPICPGVIIFYRPGTRPNNKLKHVTLMPNLYFKMFRSLVIEGSNVKNVEQNMLLEFDWLWKPLLYGNSLDFYFLKNLILSHGKFEKFLRGQELKFGAGYKRANKNKVRENIADFMILPPDSILPFISKYNLRKVRDLFPDLLFEDDGIVETYSAPHLIIKQGIRNRPILTFLDFPCAFSNVVYGLAGGNRDKKILKAVGALLSSDLAIYFLFMNSVEWGVDRHKVLKREFDNVPVPGLAPAYINRLEVNFDRIMGKCNRLVTDRGLFGKFQIDKKESENFRSITAGELKNINEVVNEIYSVSETEKDLIDYAINISIPLFKNDPEPLRSPDPGQLQKYANVFMEYFKDWYNGPDDYFKVEIYRTPFFTGMNFKVAPEPPVVPIEEPKDCEITRIIEFLGKSLSMEMITDDLFIQKDIKGFEEDSFYVIKPNEYKCWHPAVARADLLEFVDAILKSDAAAKHE